MRVRKAVKRNVQGGAKRGRVGRGCVFVNVGMALVHAVSNCGRLDEYSPGTAGGAGEGKGGQTPRKQSQGTWWPHLIDDL